MPLYFNISYVFQIIFQTLIYEILFTILIGKSNKNESAMYH